MSTTTATTTTATATATTTTTTTYFSTASNNVISTNAHTNTPAITHQRTNTMPKHAQTARAFETRKSMLTLIRCSDKVRLNPGIAACCSCTGGTANPWFWVVLELFYPRRHRQAAEQAISLAPHTPLRLGDTVQSLHRGCSSAWNLSTLSPGLPVAPVIRSR